MDKTKWCTGFYIQFSKVSLKKLFPTMNSYKVIDINIDRTKGAQIVKCACIVQFCLTIKIDLI